MILTTDASCIFDTRPYPGIPVIFVEGTLIEPASDFLRDKVRRDSCSANTATTYASKLSVWWQFLLRENRPWQQADDNLLLRWRDMLMIQGLKGATINAHLGLIFEFYLWAEEAGLVSQLISPRDSDGKTVYPLSSTPTQNGLATPLLFPTTRKPNRHIPTESECEKLDMHAAQNRQGSRNILIMMWFREAGLRRAEALNLTLNQIPSLAEIGLKQKANQTFSLTVVGKGNKERTLQITPSLMEATQLYIENDRNTIIRRLKTKPGWTRPKWVFLSERGDRLGNNSLSNLFIRLYKQAGVSNASGHRLRARYLLRLVETFIDQADNSGNTLDHGTVLLKAAEAAGHAHPDSLRPYLNRALKRRVKMSPAASNYERDQSLRIAADVIRQLCARVPKGSPIIRALEEMISVIKNPSEQGASKLHKELLRLAEKLEQSTTCS
jgi:site-specific recombinase XerD